MITDCGAHSCVGPEGLAARRHPVHFGRAGQHRFEPAELEVPAGKDLTLKVTNADATAEEFDSNDFDAEKVIAAGQTAVIKIAPLDPGRYEFFGEYHEDSAKGGLVAK